MDYSFETFTDEFGRYISSANMKLLEDSWEGLSPVLKQHICMQAQRVQEKEIEFLARGFAANDGVQAGVERCISQQRIDSLHKIESTNK